MSPRPALAALLGLLGACAAPTAEDARNQVQLSLTGDDPAAASDAFIAAIESAQSELQVGAPELTDEALAAAIIDAQDRGVAVEVVLDEDQAADPGAQMLVEALVPVTFADGGITYQDFSVNVELSFSGDDVRMTHAYAIIDRTRVLTASQVGGVQLGENIVMDVVSEDIGQDFMMEHGQIFGGLDASAQTSYFAGAKSIVDARWLYKTQTALTVELWFGPQERVVKRVIDSVYSARSDVTVLTDDFLDKGLATALQAKASTGFDVKVVVGPRFGTQAPPLSGELRDNTPDVQKYQFSAEQRIPTVVLVDQGVDRMGLRPRTQAFVLSHEIVSATRTVGTEPIPSDQLMDGNLWVLSQTGEVGPELQQLNDLVLQHLEQSEAL